MDTRNDNKNKPKTSSLFMRERAAPPKRRESLIKTGPGGESDDLPDLTPAKNLQLAAMWRMSEVSEIIPIRNIVNAVRKHLDAINPYMESLQKTQTEWYADWQLLYKIAQRLDTSSRYTADSKIYCIPAELRELELKAFHDLDKADREWDELKLQYSIEIDKRQAEISDIQKKIDLFKETNDAPSSEQVRPTLPMVVPKKSSPGFFDTLCSCCHEPQEQVTELPSAADLLREYQRNLIFKEKSLEEYRELPPPKPVHYRTAWNDIRARISHHRVDYYRCQTKDMMLQCLRLYIIAHRAYFQMYAETPFNENKQAKKFNIMSETDKVIDKIKPTFKQMIVGMKAHFSLFYCLQPNRVSFDTYLENYYAVKDPVVRDALMYGKYSPKMLAQIFTDYESPEKSFEPASMVP